MSFTVFEGLYGEGGKRFNHRKIPSIQFFVCTHRSTYVSGDCHHSFGQANHNLQILFLACVYNITCTKVGIMCCTYVCTN